MWLKRESPVRIQKLIQVGEQTCYTMQALLNPVQVTLNDRDLPVEGLTTAAAKA